MLFGLRSSVQTFQRMMDNITRDLEFVFVYLDDILIASTSEKEHRLHILRICTILKENGLTLNKSKCIFATNEINFLGHYIDKHGIRPAENKISSINNYPKPSTIKELQKFIGIVICLYVYTRYKCTCLFMIQITDKRYITCCRPN